MRSTDPTNPATIVATIINGGGLDTVVTCDSGEGSDTIRSGLVITNGFAFQGGGMVNSNGSSPTVTNCLFSGNTADLQGGGMYNIDSDPTVSNCTFSGNTIQSCGSGGGLFINGESSPTLTHSVFCQNEAGQITGKFNDDGTLAISDDHCVPLPPGEIESDCDAADANGDGTVDPLDTGFVLARFGCQG